MATQIVLENAQAAKVKAPGISTSNFFIRPVDKKVVPLSHEATENGVHATAEPAATLAQPAAKPAAKSLPAQAGVLTLLEGRTFVGKGYNTIFRPRSKKPLAGEPPVAKGVDTNILELNLTAETLTFSPSLGNVPNRGFQDQEDITLLGIPYAQSITSLENPVTGLDDRNPPTDIHFEPGLWMFVPACSKSPVLGGTLSRMASIPHGTTINAQGMAPNMSKPKRGKPTTIDIPPVDITPFQAGDPNQRFNNVFPSLEFNAKTDRIPQNLQAFNKTGKITPAILANPNQVLHNAIAKQDIESFITFTIATEAPPIVGGGTSNIAFLGGTGATPTAAGPGNNANAHAVSMTTTYWIEKVRATLRFKPEQVRDNELNIKVMTSAGVDGPTFVIPRQANLGAATNLTADVSWTQIQYSQNVLLDFEQISWPHVSVGTLGDTSRIAVDTSSIKAAA